MTSKADLLALAERCEQATANEQEAILREARSLVYPRPTEGIRSPEWQEWTAKIGAVGRMLDAGAYESAAMQLVPGGNDGEWNTGRFNVDPGKCFAQAGVQGDIVVEGVSFGQGLKVRGTATAATPALALLAALLRALAHQEAD